MAEGWDAIVVGAGPAGGTAAWALARGKVRTLLVDPQDSPAEGSSSLGGGILWEGGTRWPDPKERPPLPRRILERRCSFLSEDTAFSLQYADAGGITGGSGGWVVERSSLEPWLVEKASQSGAKVLRGAAVEGLERDRTGRMLGLRLKGGEKLSARAVVLADGPAVGLAASVGVGAQRADPRSPGPGDEVIVESAFALDEGRVDDRFGMGTGAGATIESALGFLPKGAMAFGFLYPGKDRLYTGVVAHARSIQRAGLDAAEVHRRFESHPCVAPLLRHAKRLTTSSTPVPRTRRGSRRLYGEGFVVAGEAAGLASAAGLVVRGMDLSIKSALEAAETIREGVEANDLSGRVTSRYATRLKMAGVLRELERQELLRTRMKWNPRVHAIYPKLLGAGLHRMMTEHEQPKEHLRDTFKITAREARAPYISLVRDAVEAIATL